jgi:hypothetical protein
MKLSRWRVYALALSAVGIVACSERRAITDPATTHDETLSNLGSPVAVLSPTNPTAVPIGSPARVDFSGRASASRHTLVFPLKLSPIDREHLVASARDALDRLERNRRQGPPDLRLQRAIEFVERLLAAGTPEEIRAALGPDRERVAASLSITPRGRELVDHTASFRLAGRELLRVTTRATTSKARASFECVDDPNGLAIDPSVTCEYDPYFDPQPVAADVTAMQFGLDGTSEELAALEALDALESESNTARCAAERAAYFGSLLAFTLRAGETIWFAWNRNVPKTYTNLRDATILYATTYALFLRYKQCMAGKAATD